MKKCGVFVRLIIACLSYMMFLSTFLVDVRATSDVEDTYEKRITYVTSDEGERKDEQFENAISKDGKIFTLQNIEYTTVSEEPVYEEKEVSLVRQSGIIKSGDVYTPPEEILEGGITYMLQRTEQQKIGIEGATSQVVTGTTTYEHTVTRNDIPQSKKITVASIRSGEDMEVECPLVSLEQSNTKWVPVDVNITYEEYDANYFSFYNTKVPKDDTKPPLFGYERTLLNYLGMNTRDYRMTDINWNGEEYINAQGVLCRNAIARCERYVPVYTATYSKTVVEDEQRGAIYTSIYTGTEKINNSNYIYEIEAIASYHIVDEDLSRVPKTVLVGVGILILVGGIVGVIYIFSKKKKERRS